MGLGGELFWPNSELQDEVSQNLVVLGTFFDLAGLWAFVRYGWTWENFWLWFLFGCCVFWSFSLFDLILVLTGRFLGVWNFWIFVFSRFVKIEIVFASFLLALGFVCLLLFTGVGRGTERGGVWWVCMCGCLFVLAEWVWLGGWDSRVGHGKWRVRRCCGRKVGGSGVCVRGKMSLSLFSRARMSRSVFVCWLCGRCCLRVFWARARSWLSRSRLRCLFALLFCCFDGLGGSFFLAKTAMLCSVLVCAVIVGLRMCNGAQCLAWRRGCRFLVRISAVLLAEDTPPMRISPST